MSICNNPSIIDDTHSSKEMWRICINRNQTLRVFFLHSTSLDRCIFGSGTPCITHGLIDVFWQTLRHSFIQEMWRFQETWWFSNQHLGFPAFCIIRSPFTRPLWIRQSMYLHNDGRRRWMLVNILHMTSIHPRNAVMVFLPFLLVSLDLFSHDLFDSCITQWWTGTIDALVNVWLWHPLIQEMWWFEGVLLLSVHDYH
jgi:hypothetical protein